jgi:hypothetical protein
MICLRVHDKSDAMVDETEAIEIRRRQATLAESFH